MFFRSIGLTLCLALVCLGAVVGCAPTASTAQSSAGSPVSPAVTAAPADVPTFDEQAPPSTTTPPADVPDLSL
jgi:hypothetical protein